ncbi:class II Aldolase and Adducin domain protein [Opisthorchis viverrini]|uniref:Class II Aldolase and Adducin domain protein n=1 Tax=Opisthorchis viverrini TaxID=6198 RepID=A0A1S8X9T2_OPIVI|nr:class II Aldolase and Adducin domain protein [Opisthorchis viverrini]
MPDGSSMNCENPGEKPEKFIATIDPDSPDYQRNLLRPASIKEDVNLMSQKQRVTLILNSESFRHELEEIVRSQSQSGEYPGMSTSLLSLQHISELFASVPNGHASTGVGLSKGQRNGIIPINDLRGGEATIYSRRERSLRCKLAAVYRLIDLFGWNTSIHNHVTARISSKNEHFLVNPFGLLYHEITASSLLKVDCKGQVLDPGSTVLGLNHATWMLHSAVHSARADVRCIIHVDTPATIAVSCMKSGLLPLCHEAMILGEISYYTPSSLFLGGISNGNQQAVNGDHDKLKDWSAERSAITEALGPTSRVLFLRTRGLLALGETVEEAWHYATNAVLLLASLDAENLVLPTEKLKQKTYETWRTSGLGGLSGPEAALAIRLAAVNRSSATEGGFSSSTEGAHVDGDSVPVATSRPWRLGELEFEAMMRHLDNAGCRTGHLYRQEALASPRRERRAKTLDGKGYSSLDDDIQVPPTASSVSATMAYYYDDGFLSGDETETPRPSTLRREWAQKHWLNTPNKYTKELIQPSPAHQPVSHWVSEKENAIRKAVSSGALPPPAPFHPLTPGAVPMGTTGGPATGTASVCSPYNVFAPQGSNPKEYRDQQRKVKAKYYHDTNTAGPQSRLLDNLTWDEARRVRDEGLMKVLGPKYAALVAQGAVQDVPVAAASKAIIQRDVRNAAVVYDALYSHQNPFEKITDEELEMYRREIEIKNNPELAAELERRGLVVADGALSPVSPDSLAVDSGATDLESASDTGATHLAPPTTAGTLTSEPSGTEDAGEHETKKKKKRRFKLPSFSLSRSKDKNKENSDGITLVRKHFV